MSPEHSRDRSAPAITLQALYDVGDQLIVAWPSWFAGKARRLDRLLAQYGDTRLSPSAWERSAGDRYSVVMTRADDRDSDEVVDVAVIGLAAFHDLYSGPAKEVRRGD